MSDDPPERNSNSKSNLIEVQHVGVTAKLQSPLKSVMPSYSSSTETENNGRAPPSNARYNKFSNERGGMDTDTTITQESKILYELKTSQTKKLPLHKRTPSKLEFQLYTHKTHKRLKKSKTAPSKSKRSLFQKTDSKQKSNDSVKQTSLLQRLKQTFREMSTPERSSPTMPTVDKILDDLPEPATEVHIGVYPFDHGCSDYLKTHDCPPHLMTLAVAQRATEYATKFWAEFFGSIYIGVAFLVTFVLQTYRFVLYSLVNTFLVGFLHMTSDYLLKPLLTVLFNGFLQPPLTFVYNILSSIRDLLEPIADTLNNFMKPVATVGKSIRLVHASYNRKKFANTV